MRALIKGAVVAATVLVSAPAFAQGYGYGYGYDYGPSYSYGPAYGYPDGGGYPDSGYVYGPPAYPAQQGYEQQQPVYEGRSVAVAPANGADSVAWCEAHYRSYNPQTSMYLGYDGQYHPCP